MARRFFMAGKKRHGSQYVMKKYNDLENMATIIPKSIHALGRKFEHSYRCRYTIYHWDKVVGEKVAKNSRVAKIEKGTLMLYVPDATWRNEIQMFGEEIIQKTNNFAGEKIAKKIVFVNRPHILFDDNNKKNAAINLSVKRKQTAVLNISPKEQAKINDICNFIQDNALREKMTGLIKQQKKLTAKRKRNKWHKCVSCAALCPPDRKLCPDCRRRQQEIKKNKIREYLDVYPWARYAEITKVIDCTPEDITDVRISMIQQLALTMRIDNYEKIAAHKLVMLYKCLPPEELTEPMVNETLYHLRNDMAKNEKFKPLKKADFLRNAGK